jgi:glycerol-3-phosphate cytidylyltransferase
MKKIVFTSGVFDLLHPGHINILKRAKALGDYLIVGLATDELVEKIKGYKPILTYKQRLQVLNAIKYVDHIVKQRELVTKKQFVALKANIYVKGTDWKNNKNAQGLTWLIKNKKVRFIPYTKELSTTKIKNKIVKEWKLR